MQAYGAGGLRALAHDALHRLARLYWYTVEFGLIRRPEGLALYGAGIVSSYGESVFALDDDSRHPGARLRESLAGLAAAADAWCATASGESWRSNQYLRGDTEFCM